MNKNWNLKLFSLLADASVVINEEMETAYGCFMEQVRTVSQSEQDYSDVLRHAGNTGVRTVSQSEQDYSETFRMLNITRIELAFLQALHRYGQGKKCPEIRLS